MSEENVEVLRSSFERFNRTGYLPEEAFASDVVLTNIRESPTPGPYHGHAGLRQWSDDIRDVVEECRFDIEDVADADATVIARLVLRGRARLMGIEVKLPLTVVWWFGDGRAYRAMAFSDHAEALEAARLSE